VGANAKSSEELVNDFAFQAIMPRFLSRGRLKTLVDEFINGAVGCNK
jgi:hypothetical protein